MTPAQWSKAISRPRKIQLWTQCSSGTRCNTSMTQGNKAFRRNITLAPKNITIGQYQNFNKPTISIRILQLLEMAKENNSSYGTHIGMYKVASQNPKLGWIFHLKLEIPSLEGYAPERQWLSTYVMWLKKINSWEVTELHTICLLDPEGNKNYKWLGIDEMWAEIKYGKISPEQYSQPEINAMSHGVNRRLVFEYKIYLRQILSLACSDLKICSDRILHITASIYLQRLGLPIS